MTTAELKFIFENSYNRTEWIRLLRDVFQVRDIHSNPGLHQLKLDENTFDARGVELGSFETSEGLLVGLFEVSINPEKKLERNKVGLRNLLRNVYKNDVDAALVVFTQGAKWRFTYVSEITFVNKETGKREKRQTDPKRYTYVLGQHQLCRTPVERFAALKTNADLFITHVSIKEIEKAFSVDLLTKDFYRELSNWYFWALQHVEFPDDAEKNHEIRNSANTIRLITRLIFVWFLKQKGLVPEILFEKDKIWPMLKPGYESKSTYYKAILQNLFFATLNQEMDKRGFRKGKQHYNITNLFRYENLFRDSGNALELFKGIPFLNGGLFECLDKPHPTEKTPLGAEKIIRVDGFSDRDDNPIHIPDFLFFGGADAVDLSMVYDDSRQKNLKIRGLIDILNSYNFTVEENTPLDIQVALDPELLGKVFENLLASYNPETKSTARKQTGSFYTPREIVQYMVDESLVAYLKQKLNKADDATDERNESLLRELLSYSGNGNPFNPEETRSLIEAIDQVKVLDPACGSGAFPMGILQQLVHILQKLDSQNIEWKKIQMQRAQTELQDAIASGDADNFSERIKEIAESFESNTEDYGRKLFLIENCIYGVDIQPIAVQIAKLRFFVSLLCEQTILDSKENLGIKALPNLETKFVAANTLIALDKPVLGTGNIFLSNTQTAFEELKKELNENRHKYFVAKRREQKLKCHQKDKEIREKIAKLLVHEGWKTEIAKQVASYDPYDQNQHTDWFDPEWMLGIKDGFDIMIGNPPYVSIQRMDDTTALRKANFETFEKTGDLYSLFYEQGINHLREKGILCYITSNKWINANYGKSTRRYFSTKTNPLILIDFAKVKIFESATVFVNILITEKAKNKNQLLACAIQGNHLPEGDLGEYFNVNKFILKDLGEGIWKVSNAAADSINNQIEGKGTILKEWKDIGLYAGIKSGLNEAFHINQDVQTRLIKKNPKNAEIIKPLLRGKDIKRWSYTFANWYILNTHNGLKGSLNPIYVVKDFPDIHQHLEKYLPAVQERQDQGFHWTNLRDCAFLREFEKPKIVWIEISDRANYAYDETGMFLTNSAYFMTGKHLKYILAVLNSKVADYYFFQITASIAGGRKRYTGQYVESVPVPQIPEKQEEPFNTIVDYVLFLKENEHNQEARQAYNYFESVLEAMVYELYFSDAVKEAGHEIIKHVSKLPTVKKEIQGLQQIMEIYKETYEKNHPIRNSSFYITSIPIIKVIEESFSKKSS